MLQSKTLAVLLIDSLLLNCNRAVTMRTLLRMPSVVTREWGAYEKTSPFFASIQKAQEVQELRQECSRMKYSYAAQGLKFSNFVNF